MTGSQLETEGAPDLNSDAAPATVFSAAAVAIIPAFTPSSPMKEHDATTTDSQYFSSRRPDRRRPGGNGIGAQRQARRRRPGQVEAIVERRVRAFELRRSGATYREIARQLGADLHTVHSDIQAELLAIRSQTIEEALDLRAMELERLDAMTSGLWPGIQEGSAAAVSAGVRVSEPRARLLGLDAPVLTKGEVTGSLGVYTERLAAECELFTRLSVEQLEELAAESQALLDHATKMVKANARALTSGGSTADPASGDGDESAHEEVAETPTRPDVNDA